MAVIGTILKEKREQLGYTIEEISDITTIQQRYIVALEEDDFDTIPGEYYIKSFVKQYATILKLDSNKLIKSYEKYKLDLEKEDLKVTPVVQDENKENETDKQPVDVTQLSKPISTGSAVSTDNLDNSILNNTQDNKNEKRSSLSLWLIIGLIIGIALYFIPNAVRYFMPSQSTTTTTTTTTSVATTSTSQTTQSSSQTTTETTTTTTETTTQSTTQPPQTTQSTTRAPQNTAPATTNQSAPVRTEPVGPADVYTISSTARDTNYGLGSSFKGYTGEYNLGVTVSEPTWVRVTIYGQVTYEGTLVPNSPYNFRVLNNAETVEIRLGVSHAAKLTLNGRSVKVPAGNRVQNIKFTLPR